VVHRAVQRQLTEKGRFFLDRRDLVAERQQCSRRVTLTGPSANHNAYAPSLVVERSANNHRKSQNRQLSVLKFRLGSGVLWFQKPEQNQAWNIKGERS
jgi:hypothetical protein